MTPVGVRPFGALAALPRGLVPVLLGLDRAGGLVGLDLDDGILVPVSLASLRAAFSLYPLAVAPAVSFRWAQVDELRIANPVRQLRPGMAAMPGGDVFRPLPEGWVSGFFDARPVLLRHRNEIPSAASIGYSVAFAISTANTQIDRAEEAFRCFVETTKARRGMPSTREIRACFLDAGTGGQNQKAAYLSTIEPFALACRSLLLQGQRDRALRRSLALSPVMPPGLSLAKLSFTLALLGQDTICLDARILGRMFPDKPDRDRFLRASSAKGKTGGVRASALELYEATEDLFLERNPNYDPADPVGRARAQWISWESAGRTLQPADHGVWLSVVRPLLGAVR